MQEVLRKLEMVQELDLQIGNILTKKAEFPKRLADYDLKITETTKKYDEKKKIVDELEKSKRQQLGALELNEERAKRSQEKLELVKTNNELQALQKEIESLKKNSAIIQDNANKVDEELQKVAKELGTYESTLKDVKEKRATEAAKIADEEKSFDTELARLNAQRAERAVGIEKRYMAAYDKVRQGRGGLGVVPAVAGNCKGCNMRIPPQMYNELQRGTEMHMCPSCRRILVYKDASGKASEAAASA